MYKRQRQEILDAAMQVFYLKGYEKATIRDIALDIGVAQGLIYRYFKSKEALFAAALDNYAAVSYTRLDVYKRQVLSQCLPYIGYPRSLNALRCVDEAARQR